MCGEGGAWLDMRKESKANVCEPLEALVLEAGRVLLVELCREHVDRKPIGEGGRRGRHVEQDGAEGEEGGERLRVGQGRVDGDRASLRVASGDRFVVSQFGPTTLKITEVSGSTGEKDAAETADPPARSLSRLEQLRLDAKNRQADRSEVSP